ncbi:hypothetical protein [Henriciella marina]|uniref:hypothetical protein n=1 Tax=Henriciella marina TaxID=453851 RepID=UPI00036C1DFF|nr:hypothetical protein [Henriciella marina]
MADAPGKNAPLIAAAALVGTGVLLRQWKPTLLDMPEPRKKRPHLDSGMSRKVRKARDGVAKFALPSNMLNSLGNSLLAIGGGLALLRLVDEVVDDKERLF